MRVYLFVIVFLFGFQFAFGQTIGKVYTADEALAKIELHEQFAILPFAIQYKPLRNSPKKLSKREIYEITNREAYVSQNTLMSFVLKKKKNGHLLVNPQSLKKTNAILAKKNIQPNDLKRFTSKELCELLGVDAVLGGDITISERPALIVAHSGMSPMEKGFGFISLIDKEDELLFRYDKKISSSRIVTSGDVITLLMKKSANRFPYFSKSKNLIK